MPVLVKLRFDSEKLQWFALAGPSVGYALGGRGTVTIEGVEVSEKIEFDNDLDDAGVKDRRWDFSGVVGTGGSLEMGSGRIILDVGYGLDFTDFNKFKGGKPEGYKESYNRGLGITAGYRVPIGTK